MMNETIKALLEAHSDAQQVLEDTVMGFVQETAKQQKYAKNLEVMVAQMLVLLNRHAKTDTKVGVVEIDGRNLSLELSLHAKGAKNFQDVVFRTIDIGEDKEDVKLGPNDTCHCGSGKKYKKCHMHKDRVE